MSTECVRLFNPFKKGLKYAELVVYSKIIRLDDHGHALIEIIQRYSGTCKDTIQYLDSGGLDLCKVGDKVILILIKDKSLNSKIYYSPECVQCSLIVNQKDNTVEGNITHFNAMICRLSVFFHINRYPMNHMSYKRICGIMKRKINAT